MRLFLSGIIGGVLVVGAWALLGDYMGSISLESDRPPATESSDGGSEERVRSDAPTRTKGQAGREPVGIDYETFVLDCPIGWHPPDGLPEGASYEEPHPLRRSMSVPASPDGAAEDPRAHFVRAWYCIERSGVPSDIEVDFSRPSDLWDQAVIKALSNWRFSPSKINGNPVKTCWCTRDFNIQGTGDPFE